MKYLLSMLICLISCLHSYAQNQLKVYSDPPSGEVVYDDPENGKLIPIEPLLSPENKPLNYKVEQNRDFTVRVSKDQKDWKELFGYNTYTTDGLWKTRSKATFVSFDFRGNVYIEVTCNLFPTVNFTNPDILTIRPQSKGINPYYKNGNTFRFLLSNPSKLAIEVNGERDRNLQIFANSINDYVPTGEKLNIFEKGVHKINNINTNPLLKGNIIHIKSGAIVIGDIEAKDGDEIFIEGGGILKGEIKIDGKSNVKIHGYGIIDLSNFAKQYANEVGDFYHRSGIKIINSNKIFISGITVNDSQLKGISIENSEFITIDNYKTFSRVIWGDGIYMTGNSNVKISDCYLRTADDGIAIYASRRNQNNEPSAPLEAGYSNRPAVNISVTNTILYTDAAHPVEIGWHGNYNKKNNGLEISNLRFENIDILEQDVAYLKSNGEYDRDYEGALSINCSDGNKCSDITFKDIRIEDFSNGRLFSVKVEPAGLGAATTKGKKVSNIRFENISYNGTGETRSVISGLSRNRPVDGVHFVNFRVNGKQIKKLSDYNVNGVKMIETNRHTRNISFE